MSHAPAAHKLGGVDESEQSIEEPGAVCRQGCRIEYRGVGTSLHQPAALAIAAVRKLGDQHTLSPRESAGFCC